jgi:hypothetical protein
MGEPEATARQDRLKPKRVRRSALAFGSAFMLSLLWTQRTAPANLIFGGPTFNTSSGGYQVPFLPYAPGANVNDSGTGVGQAAKYIGGSLKGQAAIRWDSAGSWAELPSLWTNGSGELDAGAYAVNGGGTVAGYAKKYSPTFVDLGARAVRWDASGVMTELGGLGASSTGVSSSHAYAVNASGLVAGSAKKFGGVDDDDGSRAVRWAAAGTVAIELGTLGTSNTGVSSAVAYAVNSSGTAVGNAKKYESGSDKGTRPARWAGTGTAAQELLTLGESNTGTSFAEAFAVNEDGTAVGYSNYYDNSGNFKGVRAVRWDGLGAVAEELASLGTNSTGTTGSYAYDIDDDGWAVGYTDKYNPSFTYLGTRAMRWHEDNTWEELGVLGTTTGGHTLAKAFAMNNSGITVGVADRHNASGTSQGSRAVYWGLDGVAVDLNTLLPAGSGWLLIDARGISDTGWISGTGNFDPDGVGGQAGYNRAFVMQLPEPGCLSWVVGMGWVIGRRRRARYSLG